MFAQSGACEHSVNQIRKQIKILFKQSSVKYSQNCKQAFL